MNIENPFDHVSETLLAKHTKANYQASYNKWLVFCRREGIAPLPVTPLRFLEFLEELIEAFEHPTVKLFISAMMSVHKYNDLPRLILPPRFDELKSISYRRSRGAGQAPILYFNQLLEIMHAPNIKKRTKALVSIMFDAMLRGDDVTHVRWEDIFSIETKDGIKSYVRIHQTKGKYNAEGHVKVLSPRTLDALDEYHQELCHSFMNEIQPQIFPISARRVRVLFTDLSKAIGFKITSHSPRVGATVEMLDAGISDTDIANVAGWSSTRMVKRYGRNQKPDKSGMAKLLKHKNKKKHSESPARFVTLYGNLGDESSSMA